MCDALSAAARSLLGSGLEIACGDRLLQGADVAEFDVILVVIGAAALTALSLLFLIYIRRRAAQEIPSTPSPWPELAAIRIASGKMAGQVIPLTYEGLSIGSRRSNDLVLKGAGVAGEHAVIQYVDGAFAIYNLRPDGEGVVLNGYPILSAYLRHGDIIQIGRVKLRFEVL